MEAEVVCMIYILALFIFLIVFIFFTRYRLNERNTIILRMNETYPNANEYVVAIKYELEKQGKRVVYSGNGHFVVDGLNYKIKERKRIITDGISMQVTILKPL